MNNLPANFLADVESTIREAGNLILTAYNLPSSAINPIRKTSGWVSDTDLEVEKFYKNQLAKIIPNSKFMGEETGGALSASGYVWVIDPIDGTYNFISKIPLFVTGIALVYEGKIIFNGVLEPVLGNYYFAYDDLAFCNNNILQVSSNMVADHGIIALSSSSTKFLDLSRKFGGVRRFGSALLTQCWLASNKLSCAVFNGLYYWDIAPAYLIMQNSGIIISGFNGFAADGFMIKNDLICATTEIIEQIKDLKFNKYSN